MSDRIFSLRILPGTTSGGSKETLGQDAADALKATAGLPSRLKGREWAAATEAELRRKYPRLRIRVERDSDDDVVWIVDEDADEG